MLQCLCIRASVCLCVGVFVFLTFLRNPVSGTSSPTHLLTHVLAQHTANVAGISVARFVYRSAATALSLSNCRLRNYRTSTPHMHMYKDAYINMFFDVPQRRKRAHILDSEAEQLSDINIAQGRKQAQVLASEGKYTERVNEAKVFFPLQ